MLLPMLAAHAAGAPPPLAAALAEGNTALCRVANRVSYAQAQLGDLQRTAGVSEAVVDAARCIWLGLVAESGVVGPDFPRCVSAWSRPWSTRPWAQHSTCCAASLVLWYRRTVEARTHAENAVTPQVGGLGQAFLRQRMPLQQALALSLQQVRGLAMLYAHLLSLSAPLNTCDFRRHSP